MSAQSAENDALTARREAVRREAAHKLWAWGWYDLAEIVARIPPVSTCRDCGAEWKPVRRGECSRCGSDNTPIPPASTGGAA